MNAFPLHLLPEPLRSFVGVGARTMDCDASYIAVPLLPAIASAIGNTRRIRLKRDWTEPAVIWAATVGESGTVKSPTLDLALRPVWRRQRAILRDHAKLRATYETDLQAWKDTPKKERDVRPVPPPPCEHPLCSDITIEALADRLLATPRGVLIAVDELSAWFGSFNQYKGDGADVAHWLSLFGARPLKVDRKGGDNTTIYVPHAAACVVGTIQPAILRRALQPEFMDNGLAARLLVSGPPAKAKRWTEDEIPIELSLEVDHLFDNLYALRSVPGVEGDLEPHMVDLTTAAREVWASFVNQHNRQLQELTGHERAAGAKLEGYAARFALVLHCAQHAAGLKSSEYIEAADIEAGVELAGWFGAETRRVFRLMHESKEDRERRELLSWVASRGGNVTLRDLQRNLRRYQHDPGRAYADLRELQVRGYGTWEPIEPNGHGGRPTERFCLAAPSDFSITTTADADTTLEIQRNGEVVSASAAASKSKSQPVEHDTVVLLQASSDNNLGTDATQSGDNHHRSGHTAARDKTDVCAVTPLPSNVHRNVGVKAGGAWSDQESAQYQLALPSGQTGIELPCENKALNRDQLRAGHSGQRTLAGNNGREDRRVDHE